MAVALAESCIAGDLGIDATANQWRASALLFGEPQSEIVVSCGAGRAESALQVMATAHGLTAHHLGAVSGDRLRFGPINVGVDDLREAYESGLPHALEGVTANV
jgi:phosphoribosylformylglycinamidine (FGAM) synthase-like enzyme